MSRRFTFVTLALTAVVAFLVGAIVAGGLSRSAVSAGSRPAATVQSARADRGGARLASRAASASGITSLVNFADVVDRLNPAVVNIDTTTRSGERRRRSRSSADPFDGPFDFGAPRDAPRRGAGSGFIIDADGSILTKNHVVDRAARIIVEFSDRRTMRARLIGSDPDTGIALTHVGGESTLPFAAVRDASS